MVREEVKLKHIHSRGVCLHVIKSRQRWCSGPGRGTAGLNGLNLVSGQGGTVEAGREIIAVEVDTGGGSNRAKSSTGIAANTGVGADGLAEGTKLLGVVTVGAERGVGGTVGEGSRKGVGWRSGVGAGSVVNGDCAKNTRLACEAFKWLNSIIVVMDPDSPGIVRLPRNLMEGVRSAC